MGENYEELTFGGLFRLDGLDWKDKLIGGFILLLELALGLYAFFGLDKYNVSIWLKMSILIILVLIALILLLFRVLRSISKRYNYLVSTRNELNSQLEKISSPTGPIAELVGGFKRKEFKWTFTVNEDESIVAERTYVIQSFRELSGIMFQKVFYPSLENNKPQLDDNFIHSSSIKTPNGEEIKMTPKVSCHGGNIFYSVKFNPVLPENSTVEIRTKPVTYPKGSLAPQPHYEDVVKEGGRAITYLSTIPTEKVRIEVVLPENKNYLALTCLGYKFFGVTSMDTDNFSLEKEAEIHRETGTPRNVFWFTIDSPTLLYEYSLFWKIGDE